MPPVLTVRHTQTADIAAIIALQQRVYPDIPAWTPAKVAHQIEVFPQGQMVARLDGRVVGAASTLIVQWDEWQVDHSWAEVTARGSFDTHTPEGRTLYGAEVFVDPTVRRAGIGHAIYRARRKLCRAMNLRRIIACGRLPGYHRVSREMSAELYARKVVWGELNDPVLSFQIKEGFQFCGVVSDYIPEDRESCGMASLIVWLNPLYKASRPTLIPPGAIL